MADEGVDDPWGFIAPRRRDEASPAAQPTPVSSNPTPDSAPDDNTGPDTVPAESAGRAGAADPDWGAIATGGSARRARGELRAEMGGATLRQRAWPIAVALALVFFAGLLTEAVAASQMLTLAGPTALVIMYPLGGVGLLVLGLLQFRFVDQNARLTMLRVATLGYAIVFAIAMALIAGGFIPVIAIGVMWLLADQLNFLVPLLLWSLAGDEFNVAEGRKVFGWIVMCTYVGQVLGLVVAWLSPRVLVPAGIPLTWLLIVDPVICFGLAMWLPRVMKDRAAAHGLARSEDLKESLASAWDFIHGVPVWRYLLLASILTFVAGMTTHMSFFIGAGEFLDLSDGDLQTLFGGVALVGFLLCWGVQRFIAQPLQDKIGIPGALIILPSMAAVAGVLMAIGMRTETLVIMATAVTLWRVPRWSVDENARRSALALVPDEKRARVSFFIDLGPVALGLIISGPLVALAFALHVSWLGPAVAVVAALIALPLAVKVIRGWEDSMMNWRLRRRKQNRTLDFD